MKNLSIKPCIFLILIIPFLSQSVFAQDSRISTEEQIKSDVEIAPCDSKERLESVRKLYEKAGAKAEEISIEKFKEGENQTVKLKGGTDETIIIGAHYDKIDPGCGAIDNWTGNVINANIYKTLSRISPQKSYIFVAFDKEESGLLGSKAMVKVIPKESMSQICSMINVDSFGFAAPQAAENMSSPKMMKMAKNLAKETRFPFGDSPISNADADSSSFIEKKIPAITFHGLSDDWQKFLHSKNDKVENVNVKSVYLGYRFILAFIGKVDAAPCGDFKYF